MIEIAVVTLGVCIMITVGIIVYDVFNFVKNIIMR